jgi:hypothetical protein
VLGCTPQVQSVSMLRYAKPIPHNQIHVSIDILAA